MILTSKDKIICLMRIGIAVAFMVKLGAIYGIVAYLVASEVLNKILEVIFGLEKLGVMDSIFLFDNPKNQAYTVVPYIFAKGDNPEKLRDYLFEKSHDIDRI